MMRGDEDNENDNYDENSSRRKGGQWIMQTPTQVARLKRLVISKCKGQIRVAGFESTEKKKKKHTPRRLCTCDMRGCTENKEFELMDIELKTENHFLSVNEEQIKSLKRTFAVNRASCILFSDSTSRKR